MVKRVAVASLAALMLLLAAPAAQAWPVKCHKVKVHLDDGTHSTVRVCERGFR